MQYINSNSLNSESKIKLNGLFMILFFYFQINCVQAQYDTPVYLYPGDNLQQVVNANPEGTLYIFKEGTHRMQKIIPKSDDIFIGEPGAVMNGSLVLDDWTQRGEYWVHDIPAEYASPSPTFGGTACHCEKEYPIQVDTTFCQDTKRYTGCLYFHSIFMDDKPLWRETSMSGLNNLPDTLTAGAMVMKPFYGDWYFDTETLEVYLSFDPTGHKIESTVNFQNSADYAFFNGYAEVQPDNVTIKGLLIEKYAPTWAAIFAGSDSTIYWTIENNDVRLNHTQGIFFNSNALVRSNYIHHNGQVGFGGRGKKLDDGTHSVVDNNQVAFNNYAGFDPNWHAGASKFLSSNGIVMRNNYVHNNRGHGLWMDYQNYNSTYEGNVIENNGGAGIFHEISGSASIRCNQLINNRSRLKDPTIGAIDFTQNLYISTSSDVLIENNYIRNDTSGRAVVIVQNIRNGFCGSPVEFRNNDVVYSYFPGTMSVVGAGVTLESIPLCGGVIPSHELQDNRYHLFDFNPASKNFSHFDAEGNGRNNTWEELQALGFELNGTVDSNIIDVPEYAECADIPKQMLVKVNLLLDCFMEEGVSEMKIPDPESRKHFQPFSGAPWNYSGLDICPKFYENIIDWVMLEIRDTEDPQNIYTRKAAILLSDGRIVDAYPALQGVAQPGDMLDGVVIYDLIPNQEYLISVTTRQQRTAWANQAFMLPNQASLDLTNSDNVASLNQYNFIAENQVAFNGINVEVEASALQICLGDSISIIASSNLSSSELDFAWITSTEQSNTLSVTPLESNTYQVIATDVYGCTDSDDIAILVTPIPNKPSVSGALEVTTNVEELYTIESVEANGNYQWTIIGGDIISNQNNEVSVIWSDTFSLSICVSVISELGCESLSECLTVAYLDLDQDDDGFENDVDCDDSNSEVNPGMEEIIYNGIDDDCNPETLDDDLDQDGFLLIDDCDDTNSEINPNQTEVTYNGIDDDCNPETLDDDLDQDGFIIADDCDDINPEVNTDETEIPYNGLDDDCNPETLDDDLDQDGFILVNDCDDLNATINPNQIEEPYNGLDDDCNPETLDDDLDQDGFILEDDCDDTNFDINPTAIEIANNDIDEDCDGMDLVSSIHELSSARVKIYPNPVIDVINIEVAGVLDFRVSLFDLTGKLILSDRGIEFIHVNTLPQGTYLLELEDIKTGNKVIEKIIVGM